MDKDCVFWQGLYFNDYPVTLSVDKIESGEQFLGWYSDSGELLSTELEIEIELAETPEEIKDNKNNSSVTADPNNSGSIFDFFYR